MSQIRFMLDPVSRVAQHPHQRTMVRWREAARHLLRPRDAGSTATIEVALPAVGGALPAVKGALPAVITDVDACNAFDRRPPLEAMSALWLDRESVVTVYDCGHSTDASGSVYDAVFRLQQYVWIRSPAPVLKDDLLYP